MNPASKDICTSLAANPGFELTFGTNLFAGKEPAIPHNCVTVFDIPGYAPLMTLEGKGGIQYYQPSVQVRVRNDNYLDGWNLIHDIQEFLHGINGRVEGGVKYLLIKAVDEPMLLDWDEEGRARFITTFSIHRSRR
jgi:hypothetical protein